MMRVGTKSFIYGAHCFIIHGFFVYCAWCKLFGITIDPRIIFCCFFHDIGYIGKKNMDGEDGESHPELGAIIASFLFDGLSLKTKKIKNGKCVVESSGWQFGKWGSFSLCHSRFYAKKIGMEPSRLCAADKYAMSLEPYWFYILRVFASGEIHEYIELSQSVNGKYGKFAKRHIGQKMTYKKWFEICTRSCRDWAMNYAQKV